MAKRFAIWSGQFALVATISILWISTQHIYFAHSGLDASWLNALFHIKHNNYEWKDLIYTFGPTFDLLYLDPKSPYFNFIYYISLFSVCSYIFYKRLKVFYQVAILLTILICLATGHRSMFAIALILSLSMIISRNIIEYVMCAILISILSLSKFSLGSAILISTGMGVVFNSVYNKAYRELFLKLSILSMMGISTYIILYQDIDLIKFIIDRKDILVEYSSAMSSFDNSPTIWVFVPITTLILIVIIHNRTDRNLLGTVVAVIIISFFAFKSAYTRADGHVQILYQYNVFILVFVAFLLARTFFRNHKSKIVIAFAILILAYLAYRWKFAESRFKFYYEQSVSILDNSNKFFENIELAVAHNSNFAVMMVDDYVSTTETVDGFPIELTIPIFSKGKYVFRPLLQEYAAYSDDLERLNYDAVRSNPPDWFVVTDLYEEIDGRIPGMNSLKIIDFIRKNYELNCEVSAPTGAYYAKRIDPELNFSPGKIEEIRNGVLELGSWSEIDIPYSDNALPVFRANIEYSILGKMQKFIYKPSLLWLDIMANGKVQSYRVYGSGIESWTFFGKVNQSRFDIEAWRIRSDENSHYEKNIGYRIGLLGTESWKPIMSMPLLPSNYNGPEGQVTCSGVNAHADSNLAYEFNMDSEILVKVGLREGVKECSDSIGRAADGIEYVIKINGKQNREGVIDVADDPIEYYFNMNEKSMLEIDVEGRVNQYCDWAIVNVVRLNK